MSEDYRRGEEWLRRELGCDQDALSRLRSFARMLEVENKRQNLVAASSLPGLWWRHVVDSAQLLSVSRETKLAQGIWLDLGSGAGFPGMVVAILCLTRPVTLVEERRLRSDWLLRVAGELGLEHVHVLSAPAAKVRTFPAAVISARAFAPLPRLLRVAGRFSTRETLWLLPKGERAGEEVGRLPQKLGAMFQVKPSVTDPSAGIIVGRGQVELA
jgi:16S rRNA (guanine527-N7)-methyltransferase